MTDDARAPGRLPRSISSAGYLAYLYGIFGVLTGTAAAGTFLPYATQSTYDPSLAGLFTGIAVAGTVVSGSGIVAAWGLFRSKVWAWNLSVGVGLLSIALNAALAALWPGYVAFLVLVALAYGAMLLLPALGRPEYRASTAPRGG